MTTLQERMASDLAQLDDNFAAEPEGDSFSSASSEEVEIPQEEQVDEADAAAAAALRDQLLQAAGRQPAASKRVRKGGPRRQTTKKEETQQSLQSTESSHEAQDSTLPQESVSSGDESHDKERFTRRPLRATKSDVLTSLAANRERRQLHQQLRERVPRDPKEPRSRGAPRRTKSNDLLQPQRSVQTTTADTSATDAALAFLRDELADTSSHSDSSSDTKRTYRSSSSGRRVYSGDAKPSRRQSSGAAMMEKTTSDAAKRFVEGGHPGIRRYKSGGDAIAGMSVDTSSSSTASARAARRAHRRGNGEEKDGEGKRPATTPSAVVEESLDMDNSEKRPNSMSALRSARRAGRRGTPVMASAETDLVDKTFAEPSADGRSEENPTNGLASTLRHRRAKREGGRVRSTSPKRSLNGRSDRSRSPRRQPCVDRESIGNESGNATLKSAGRVRSKSPKRDHNGLIDRSRSPRRYPGVASEGVGNEDSNADKPRSRRRCGTKPSKDDNRVQQHGSQNHGGEMSTLQRGRTSAESSTTIETQQLPQNISSHATNDNTTDEQFVDNENEGSHQVPKDDLPVKSSRFGFKGLLGGRGKQTNTANDETPNNLEAINEDCRVDIEDKTGGSGSRFKSILGLSKTKAPEKESPGDPELTGAGSQVASQAGSTTGSQKGSQAGSEDGRDAFEHEKSTNNARSRGKFKGFLSRGLKGSSGGGSSDAAAAATADACETTKTDTDFSWKTANDENAENIKKALADKSRWFASIVASTSKEEAMMQYADSDQVGEMSDELAKAFSADDIADPESISNIEISTEEEASKSKKVGKWNFATKLKLNLKQEQPKIEKYAKSKNETDDDSHDEKKRMDYGLMNSLSSFNEDDLKDLEVISPQLIASKNSENGRSHLPTIMDRRMMMGTFQGQSKKFDFSSHSQDAPMAMRKTKTEAVAEIEDSGSSLDLDASKDFCKIGQVEAMPVDAFALLNSSSSSNPPERRMVFSSTLLREPSQRFDFQTNSAPSPEMGEMQDTIDEGEESGEEDQEEAGAIGTEMDLDLLEPEGVVLAMSIEKEAVKSVSKGAFIDEDHSECFSGGGCDEDTIEENVCDEANVLDDGMRSVDESGADDDSIHSVEKGGSSLECAQLDLGENGSLKVCIHVLLENPVQDGDKFGNILLLDSDQWRTLDTTHAHEDGACCQSEASLYNMLVRELSASQRRTAQTKSSVRLLQKELAAKKRDFAAMESRRRRLTN